MKRIRDLLKHKKLNAIRIKLALLPKEWVQSFKNRMLKLALKIVGYPFSSILLFGIALRLFLAPFTSHPGDTVVYYQVSNDLLAGLDVYTTKSFTYPPLWAYTLFPIVKLASSFINPNWFGVWVHDQNLSVESWTLPIITSPLFNIIFKIPLIIADTLIGIMIYILVKELRTEKLARFGLTLWFFNPLVIWVNSIHGQIDVFPALMTVLSFILFCKRNYFASGIAISLGALFKIYPVYLIPLYLFSVASLESNSSLKTLKNIKKTFVGCLKFVSGLLIPAIIFLFPLINSNFLYAVFARMNIIPSAGGLSLFNIIYCPGFEWVFPWIIKNSVLVSRFLGALGVGISAFVSFLCFFSGRKNFLKTFVLGHIAVLTVVYLTTLTVNPQYIIWIVPFLILSYGLYQHYLVRLHVLSIVALIFLIGLSGPLFFLYPAAIFTPFFSAEILTSHVGFSNTIIAVIILLFSGISGSIILLSFFKGTATSLLKIQNTPKTPPVSQQADKKKSQPSKLKWHLITPLRVLTLMLIVLIVGQFMVYIPPKIEQTVVLNVDNYAFSRDNFNVRYTIKSGNYPANVQILGMLLTATPIDKDVFIYYDEDFPSSCVTKASWNGFWDHAPIELQLRGYKGSINRVNAAELRLVMQENGNSIVIIPSGVFPDTVHTKYESFVGNWLQSGGTLVWMGDVFGYYSGQKRKAIDPTSEENPGLEGQTRILGFSLLNETMTGLGMFACFDSNLSLALDLQYPNAFVGASISEVRKHGGLALGKISNSENARTSIAYVPVGDGHLILFGGGIGGVFTPTGEDVIAKDVAQILCSGFLFSTGYVTFSNNELKRNEEKEGVLNLTLSDDGENSDGVIIVAFSKAPYIRFFTRHTLFRD